MQIEGELMRQICCTRFVNRSDFKILFDLGIQMDIVPFIKTQMFEEDHFKESISRWKNTVILAVFTSKQAVIAVSNALKEEKYNIPWQIACLDQATLEAVRYNFPTLEIVFTASNAEDLALKIITYDNPIVLFNGDRSLPTILEACCVANKVVNRVIVYETLLTPVLLEKKYEGIVFWSPSAVESYFRLNIFQKGMVAFCIGKTTENAFRSVAPHIDQIVCALGHHSKGILDSIVEYYKTEK